MLTLTLGKKQVVQIGRDVQMHIQHVGNGRVVLSFDAPKSIRITRVPLTQPEDYELLDQMMSREGPS